MFPLVKDYSLSDSVSPINITESNPLVNAVMNTEHNHTHCMKVSSGARLSMPPAIPANSMIDVIIRPKPRIFLNMMQPLSITIVIENVNDTATGMLGLDDQAGLRLIVSVKGKRASLAVKRVGDCVSVSHVVSQLLCGNDTGKSGFVQNICIRKTLVTTAQQLQIVTIKCLTPADFI